MISKELIKKLRCINCRSELKDTDEDNHLLCENCLSEYPVEFGIPSILNHMAEEYDWNIWDSEVFHKIGESYYKRTIGELPEKESSKSFANIMKRKNLHNKKNSLLDVGSACGHFYRSFYNRLDKDIKYTGADIVLDFLKKGREAYKNNNNVHFVHCNALNLPFAENSFDTVIANLFHFFPRIDDPLKEVIKVAKKRVILRMPLGKSNYVIKTIYRSDFNRNGVIEPNRNDYQYELCMIYTAEYLENVISSLGWKIDFIEKDTHFEDFDNNTLNDFDLPSSKVIGGIQTAGCIILDWHYICILIE